jgi:hypothetical protein
VKLSFDPFPVIRLDLTHTGAANFSGGIRSSFFGFLAAFTFLAFLAIFGAEPGYSIPLCSNRAASSIEKHANQPRANVLL